MSNASQGHIIGGRPIYQQYETGPIREPASFAGVRLDFTQHSKHSATEFKVRPVSVVRAGQRGQRTTAGQEKDNSRTREDKTRPRGQSVWPALFF